MSCGMLTFNIDDILICPEPPVPYYIFPEEGIESLAGLKLNPSKLIYCAFIRAKMEYIISHPDNHNYSELKTGKHMVLSTLNFSIPTSFHHVC